ncbi:MAG: hypothetical protein ACYSWX_06095 [Planctomycetota bacterium]
MHHCSLFRSTLTLPITIATLAATAHAQGPAFQSPGISPYSQRGQVNRFSTEFNPAIGGVIDGLIEYDDADRDRWDAYLRLIEINASAYVDPDLWAWVVLTAEGEDAAPEVEEAGAEYLGFDSNVTIKAGRFFLDFGKQMQFHVEELRTFRRPLVLREYLGEELGGDGVQVDWWTPLGDNTPFRVSAGMFGSLFDAHDHEGEELGLEPEGAAGPREDLTDLSFTARMTVMHELSESQTIQAGASWRYLPEYTLAAEDGSAEADGLSNSVYGLDLTWGWTGETGVERALLGSEFLWYDGDLSGEFDDPNNPTVIEVANGTAAGFMVYADYAWNQNWSAGVQYSEAEMLEGGTDSSELDFYLTWHQTEFRRLRLGTIHTETDGEGDSSLVYLQATAFLGSHTHAINW